MDVVTDAFGEEGKMRLFGVKVEDWTWVTYPILVVVMIVVGLNFFLSGGVESLDRMLVKPTQTHQEELEAAQLEVKLNKLRAINTEDLLLKMKKLLVAVPPSKRVWLLLAELQLSASEAGMTIDSYKATVGDVKEASESAVPVAAEVAASDLLSLTVVYNESSYENVILLMESLQKLKPLIKVVTVEYKENKATVTVESAWSAWQSVASQVGMDLPEYNQEVNQALTSTEGLVEISSW